MKKILVCAKTALAAALLITSMPNVMANHKVKIVIKNEKENKTLEFNKFSPIVLQDALKQPKGSVVKIVFSKGITDDVLKDLTESIANISVVPDQTERPTTLHFEGKLDINTLETSQIISFVDSLIDLYDKIDLSVINAPYSHEKGMEVSPLHIVIGADKEIENNSISQETQEKNNKMIEKIKKSLDGKMTRTDSKLDIDIKENRISMTIEEAPQ